VRCFVCWRQVLNGRRCAFASAQDGQLSIFGGSSGESFSTNPTTAPFVMSIIFFIHRWPIQSYRLIASDPSSVWKATRECSPSCCRRSHSPFFGNQVNLVRYEEVRLDVCTDIFEPFLVRLRRLMSGSIPYLLCLSLECDQCSQIGWKQRPAHG